MLVIELRKLTSDDIEQFRALFTVALTDVPVLFLESLEEFEQRSMEELASMILGDDRFMLGAFDSLNNLVAMIGFRREKSTRLNHIGMIWGLYVSPQARGQKLGHKLILETLKEAKNLPGLLQIKLQLEAGNARAKKLYESFGFQVWGMEPRAVRVGDSYYDDYHMMLNILDDIDK